MTVCLALCYLYLFSSRMVIYTDLSEKSQSQTMNILLNLYFPCWLLISNFCCNYLGTDNWFDHGKITVSQTLYLHSSEKFPLRAGGIMCG